MEYFIKNFLLFLLILDLVGNLPFWVHGWQSKIHIEFYIPIFQNHHYGLSCHMEQHLLCVFFYLWLFNIIPEVGAILLSTHQFNKYRKFYLLRDTVCFWYGKFEWINQRYSEIDWEKFVCNKVIEKFYKWADLKDNKLIFL